MIYVENADTKAFTNPLLLKEDLLVATGIDEETGVKAELWANAATEIEYRKRTYTDPQKFPPGLRKAIAEAGEEGLTYTDFRDPNPFTVNTLPYMETIVTDLDNKELFTDADDLSVNPEDGWTSEAIKEKLQDAIQEGIANAEEGDLTFDAEKNAPKIKAILRDIKKRQRTSVEVR